MSTEKGKLSFFFSFTMSSDATNTASPIPSREWKSAGQDCAGYNTKTGDICSADIMLCMQRPAEGLLQSKCNVCLLKPIQVCWMQAGAKFMLTASLDRKSDVCTRNAVLSSFIL